MPTPAHCKIVISGTMPGGEVWSTGFSVLGEAGNQATLDTMTSDVKTFLAGASAGASAIRAVMSSQNAITAVRGYSYAAGATSANLVSEQTMNTNGGGGTPTLNQAAICASLRSATPGRRARGRMFWPANGIAYGANTGQTSLTIATALASGTAALLNVLSGAGAPIVVSRVGATYHEVVRVLVDTRLDVIRNRANKQQAVGVGTADV